MGQQAWTMTALLAIALVAGCLVGRTGAAAEKPNIVLILLDDVDHTLGSDSPERMPKLDHYLAKQGINFTNYFVNFALCCPSRTSLLTGRCSHNTGVIFNLLTGLLAGEERFIGEGHEDHTLAVWLKDAGYRTGLVGKYLNGYGYTKGLPPNRVPKGWDDWLAFITIDYFNWTASDNGKNVSYGNATADYSTDVLKARALKFVEAEDDAPFFLYLTPYAAHAPERPAPRHDGHFNGLKIPRVASWPGTYKQIKDKVTALKLYPKFQQRYLDLYDFIYQKRAETLLAVDELIEELFEKLEATGKLNNTYVFFTSDNGYHLGHHKMAAGKTSPYEDSIHLFLYVRGPGVPQGLKLPHVLGSIDLAPTILDLTGAKTNNDATRPIDGISFAPLLRDPKARALDPEGLRAGFLVEKLFVDSDPNHVPNQVVNNDPYHDPFHGWRYPALSYWQEAAARPPKPYTKNDTLGPGDYNYDQNLVNRGDELTPDGKALRKGPFGNPGSPAGTNFGPYYEAHGFNATDYFNLVAFDFPSTYYGVRLVDKKLGSLLYAEFGTYGHELYNVTADPYQIHNLFPTADAALVTYLQNLLDKLKYCKGSATCSPTAKGVPTFLFDKISLKKKKK